MVTQEDYRITLDSFQGPLDLLLYLVRRAEVDVHDIPIATITDQYLEVLRAVDDVDVEQAGEFLVLAATLVEIKSRMLMPPDAQGSDDGDAGDRPSSDEPFDPRHELIQQLLAYQRYRISSEELDLRRVLFEQRFASQPAWKYFEIEEDEDREDLEFEDVHVFDLSEAYERIASAIDFAKLGAHHVEFDDTPIELYEEDLLDRLGRSPARELTLQSAFEGQSQLQRIGLFMATLELTRLRRVTVQQDDIDREIMIALREGEAEPSNDARPVAPSITASEIEAEQKIKLT